MKASRIVVLLHELSRSGAPRLTLDILEGLTPGPSIRVISREGGPLVDAARRLGPTVVLRPTGLERMLPRPLATERVAQVLVGGGSRIRALRQSAALRTWKPDLVYVSSVAALPLVPLLHLRGVPVVLQVHELGSALAWFERLFPGLIGSIPDRYAAVSEAVAHDLIDHLGVPADEVRVISPYVVPPVPSVRQMPDRDGRTPVVVGGAGNPGWTKGVDLWLLAARETVDRLGEDRVRFVWVGVRDNQAGLRFRTMVSKLALDGVVELVSETPDVYEQFARFDIFSMASWEDSFAMVVLETMAMGVPVICFAPTGGPAEAVGGAGVVIPAISPHLMADAIVDLVEAPLRRQAMGTACAARVREKFSRAVSISSLADLFDSAVAAREGQPDGAGGRPYTPTD